MVSHCSEDRGRLVGSFPVKHMTPLAGPRNEEGIAPHIKKATLARKLLLGLMSFSLGLKML